ncbi:uncharacterized protein LOC117616643 [Prunus dulcis]|uniref:uncharacterized protein LOC117616643 n=1 Tax=Prunus dulcis TaxID=3755 RepID=UPI001481D29C|nr:uncharacterized protein LOC117616643 [Prunus dulcis]
MNRFQETPKVHWEPITFCQEEEEGILYPHDDPMIIRAEIADYDVRRVLIDTGSSVSVIFAKAFREMGINDNQVDRQLTPLLSFSGDLVQPIGSVRLPITFGTAPKKATTYDLFLIVDCPTAYNVIVGRTALTRIKAHLSPHMLLMKFPTPNGPGAIRGNQFSARTCYATALKATSFILPNETMTVQGLPNGPGPVDDPRDESPTPHTQPAEELETITLSDEQPDRQVRIGTRLTANLRTQFIDFLRHHSEVFAWSYEDMPGIAPDVISHKLTISSAYKPVRQKRRSYDVERYEAMRTEVEKLQTIGFIREATYPVWLANSVMVRKSTGGWRMCQDYTDLNKACPKDSFPLPRIDQLGDATAGHELLSFMDAYSGYNQIFMHPPDSEHTAFITDKGTAEDHLQNLSIMFGILKDYRMRLNPKKCAVGVSSGKFLGFMISQRGIEANPEKIKAIIDMERPKTTKAIQSLTGRVAALTRFISKATDKCVPFFKALKGGKRDITWAAECDNAFQALKNYMSKAPLLSKPLPGEILYLYLSVSGTAVSSVLIRKPEKAELPIFYVSKALQSAELRYPPLEQLALALVVSARRLRPYFQAHGIKVLTNQPLRQVLQKPEISGRLIKWAIELGEFDIQFVPRPAEKSQAVADFISELTPATVQPTSEAITETILPDQPGTERLDTSTPVWGLHVDGSANQQGCGAGLVLTTPDGQKIEYALRFDFRTSNNEAEYEALLAGLRLAKSMNAKQIRIHSDSQLIVNQVTADFAAKDASMYAYLSTAHQLLRSFQAYEIKQIPRGENSHADALARLASAINDKVGRKVPVEILTQPSTVTSEACAVRYEDTWMSPIYLYLTNGTLPEDKAQARKLRYRSARYTVINDVLYKRGYTTPYLKCLTAEQGEYILREIHSGVCGDHSGSRSLAYKAFRQGYFWPTMHQDANSLVKRCDKCQRFGNVPHIPAEPLTPIVSPWPFAQWGLDLIGPMPQGKGQLDKAKGAWPKKLPEALWAIRTSYRTSIGETPFSMAFGSEAVVPVEIGEPSYRTESFAPKENEEAMSLSLDLLEEHRAQANLRNEAYKQRVSRYYDSRVRPRFFRIGDWVMRKVSLATKDTTEGTLGPSWEGPYEVIGILRSGTYRLRGTNGKALGHPWNVEHLKYYYK